MSHLLAIAVGPVQEFIAAARRTRDLWFGSYLLSEISRAVAKAVEIKVDGKTNLIFPASSDAENVANIILAELPTGDPRTIAAKAKQAAQNRWLGFASEAHREASGVIRKDMWEDQVDGVIEFYAAWVARTAEYKADRARVMRLVAGRKNCRDFKQAKRLDAGLPKSSLDGQRATVLQKRKKFPTHLRIREGEQLDVVGLVKRVAEGNRPYPSVSRIAADPWVRGNQGKSEFRELLSICEEIRGKVLHRLDKQVFPQFKDFPYEGTAVYISRHHEWEQEIDDEDRVSLSFLQDTLDELPEPSPYLAVLVADGDNMGAAISALDSADKNREFSETLAGFASAAKSIVEQHNGVLVYAGGDDVLAFLPVDKCLRCARKLHKDFGDRLQQYKTDKDKSPTLSVGIAIGHFMENLEDLLEYGRAAEKAAKKVEGKDALAVHLHKRGGAPIKIASAWSEHPDERLTRYAELIRQEAIPGKLPYDLRNLAEVYEDWTQDTLVQALRADVLRVIRDKQPRAGRRFMKEIEELVHSRLTDAVSLYRFAEELLVARQIAAAMNQASERRVPLQGATS